MSELRNFNFIDCFSMGNTFVIIRQGIFASLTGGWVYEPQQESFCNAIHLYMWLFLLCYPLVLFWVSFCK